MTVTLKNWAGNHVYEAVEVQRPQNVEQVREVVARSPKVRVLGTRHSFNDIADCPGGTLVSLDRMTRLLSIDRGPRPTVTVEGGISYGPLCKHLAGEGFALPNLASLPHISVAGACATATHGSGVGNGVLATAVAAMDVATAGGELRTFSRDEDGDAFAGAVVGLGGLGAVVRLTLNVRPMFHVAQRVYENLPLAALDEHFDDVMASGYSVSLFTDWRGDQFTQVWVKRAETDAAPRVSLTDLGATAATGPLHPIGGISPENCTPQMGEPGPWHERLPHFRMEFTPSAGDELQSEYLLPRRRAVAAVRAVHGLRDRIAPLLQVSEVRTVAADDFWMSPCRGQDCVAVHFTWRPDWPGVRALLPALEAALAPYDARPHWGKLFTTRPSELRRLYPKLRDFSRLLLAHDPAGKFRNPFLDRYVFGDD